MRIRRKIYLTDRTDDGRILGYLIAVDDDYSYDVELAPHLTVISDDGVSRIGGRGTRIRAGADREAAR